MRFPIGATKEVLQGLANAVIEGDEDSAREWAKRSIELGIDPLVAIREGLMAGMRVVGERFANMEIFLPEVLLAADAMKTALEILEPLIVEEEREKFTIGRVVIGTIEGDIHDIGKNIVAMMLKANGFDVVDIGVDVSPEEFILKAEEAKADIIAVSALLSTSLPYVEDLIRLLEGKGLRDKYRVMVGGGAITREYAQKIGADGYGEDAEEAVQVAKRLIGRG